MSPANSSGSYAEPGGTKYTQYNRRARLAINHNEGTLNIHMGVKDQEQDPRTRLLKRLAFPEMYTRQCALSGIKVHSDSFAWILSPEHDGNPIGFGEWLKNDSKLIYWITGRPGSGKSMLMNWIASAKQPERLLRSWAPSAKVLICKHFFWLSGTKAQKLASGMLRSVLHQILEAIPTSYDAVEPILCAGLPSDPEIIWHWSFETLKKALNAVTKALPVNFKLVFLLDGLDECARFEEDEDNREALLRMLSKLANRPKIKICLSSREDRSIRHGLGLAKVEQIRLQEHNKMAITNYTRRKFQKEPRLAHLLQESEMDMELETVRTGAPDSLRVSSKIDPQTLGVSVCMSLDDDDPTCPSLVRLIRFRADGVFLWVKFVVKDLVQASEDHITVKKALKIVEAFPDDLDSFYQRIIFDQEKYYRQSSARLLLMATWMELYYEDVLCPVYYYLSQEDGQDYMGLEPLEAISNGKSYDFIDLGELVQRSVDFVKKRGGHLLSVVPIPERPLAQRVLFAHRTGKEFLQREDVLQELLSRAGPDFNALKDLSVGMIMTWSILERFELLPKPDQSDMLDMDQEKMIAREDLSITWALFHRPSDMSAIVNALFKVNEAIRARDYGEEFADKLLDALPDRQEAVNTAISSHLWTYVIQNIKTDRPGSLRRGVDSTLARAITACDFTAENLEVLRHCLQNGCSPYDGYIGERQYAIPTSSQINVTNPKPSGGLHGVNITDENVKLWLEKASRHLQWDDRMTTHMYRLAELRPPANLQVLPRTSPAWHVFCKSIEWFAGTPFLEPTRAENILKVAYLLVEYGALLDDEISSVRYKTVNTPVGQTTKTFRRDLGTARTVLKNALGPALYARLERLETDQKYERLGRAAFEQHNQYLF